MTLFLTSSPTLGWAGDLNPANGLLASLRRALPHPIHCLMITSAPDDREMTDRMAWEMREIFERADLAFDHYEVLDRRTQRYVARMLREANFIILCGGHVPTQNRFFQELDLARRLQKFQGTMLTISAGSMNCADVVYSSPELDGESLDPQYLRYLPGLGLTSINIMPHLQVSRDAMLDGKRLIDDIIAHDSYGRPVYLLPDGSYFVITTNGGNTRAELRGEAYLMRYGETTQICHDDERRLLLKGGKFRTLK